MTHIAVLVDPEIPVPPKLYGGIERIAHFLVNTLVERGHRVTLFAHPESDTNAELQPWHGGSSGSKRDTVRNAVQLARFVAAQRQPLVVHSYARLAYMLPILGRRIGKVMSYQREITPRSVRYGNMLARGALQFTACSAKCASSGNVAGPWHVVYNGVVLADYDFQEEVANDAPLMFLGRVEPIKGVHHAIDVARRAGRKLIVAGNLPQEGPHVDYAQRMVRMCDGEQIEYVGPVDDVQKNDLLGRSAALLMPIEWEEPFGIVQAEALACGTPVLGFRRGSVPEVVDEGSTGFITDTADELVAAVGKLSELDRAACRHAAETRFSSEVIVDEYESVYRAALAAATLSQ